MPSPEEGARQAIMEFYQALDALLLGKGTERMREAWWHDEMAETVHPFGHWARGWAEVWATWQESAQVFSFYKGHAGREDGIGGIRDLRIRVLGDVAVATSVYESTLYVPVGTMRLKVNCTNVAHRRDGVWKLLLHHADQAPADYQAGIASFVNAA